MENILHTEYEMSLLKNCVFVNCKHRQLFSFPSPAQSLDFTSACPLLLLLISCQVVKFPNVMAGFATVTLSRACHLCTQPEPNTMADKMSDRMSVYETECQMECQNKCKTKCRSEFQIEIWYIYICVCVHMYMGMALAQKTGTRWSRRMERGVVSKRFDPDLVMRAYIDLRRKFRSQTSDNMDRWKADGKSQREEKSRREKIREEKEPEERRRRCAKR